MEFATTLGGNQDSVVAKVPHGLPLEIEQRWQSLYGPPPYEILPIGLSHYPPDVVMFATVAWPGLILSLKYVA